VNPDFNSRSVSARFSAAARSYDRAATTQFHSTMKLVRRLDEIKPPASILDVGCGTGQLTRLVADKFPQATVEGIDIATRAVSVAEHRFAGGAISFKVADALTFTSNHPFELIVSGSSFHWIEPLGSLFKNMARNLRPDGTMVFSMMLHGTLAELRDSRSRTVFRRKPDNASLPTQEKVMEAVASTNLEVTWSESELLKVEYPSATEFLYNLHDTGVTGGAVSSTGTPLNRTELACLIADYMEHNLTDNGGVFASFKILYAMARHKA
jgi:malonyl-CoA O-methyltransferase